MKKYIERPADEFYNVGHWSGDHAKPYPIITGEIVDRSIVVHSPEWFKDKWSKVSIRFFIEIETDKSALTFEEYKNLFPNVRGGWAKEVMDTVLRIYTEEE